MQYLHDGFWHSVVVVVEHILSCNFPGLKYVFLQNQENHGIEAGESS